MKQDRVTLRRLVIFLTLMLLLAGVYQLSRIAQRWHYVIDAIPGQLLYVTSFDAYNDDWEQYNERSSAEVVDGVLEVFLATTGRIVYSAVRPYFDDFDVSVDARALEGSEDNAYGILFRQRDRDNFYAFLVSSNGYYRVERTLAGSTRPLSEWYPTPLVQTGLNAVNRLRVVGYEDRFQFYINGESVDLCIPDDPEAVSTYDASGECMRGRWTDTLRDSHLRYGRVALGVKADPSTEIRIAFDNVVITGPRPIRASRDR